MTNTQSLMWQSASYSQEAKAFFEEANWLYHSFRTMPISEPQYAINRIGELTKSGLTAFQEAQMLQRKFIGLQRELIMEQEQDYL